MPLSCLAQLGVYATRTATDYRREHGALRARHERSKSGRHSRTWLRVLRTGLPLRGRDCCTASGERCARVIRHGLPRESRWETPSVLARPRPLDACLKCRAPAGRANALPAISTIPMGKQSPTCTPAYWRVSPSSTVQSPGWAGAPKPKAQVTMLPLRTCSIY
jgi:hypothetical protein